MPIVISPHTGGRGTVPRTHAITRGACGGGSIPARTYRSALLFFSASAVFFFVLWRAGEWWDWFWVGSFARSPYLHIMVLRQQLLCVGLNSTLRCMTPYWTLAIGFGIFVAVGDQSPHTPRRLSTVCMHKPSIHMSGRIFWSNIGARVWPSGAML